MHIISWQNLIKNLSIQNPNWKHWKQVDAIWSLAISTFLTVQLSTRETENISSLSVIHCGRSRDHSSLMLQQRSCSHRDEPPIYTSLTEHRWRYRVDSQPSMDKRRRR